MILGDRLFTQTCELQMMDGKLVIQYLVGADVLGAGAGVGSVAVSEQGASSIISWIQELPDPRGIGRARHPQTGDYWPRCDSARAAGTAPIYADEPGYRPALDGDSDGIACEPYYR